MKALLQARGATIVAAVGGGALTVAGFAPLGAVPIPFATLAFLLNLWRGSSSARDAFRIGFAFGAGLFGAGVSWVYVSLHDFGMMPAPLAALGTLAFCAILALYPAAAGWCLARLRPDSPFGSVLAFSAVWTLFEWIRGWLFTGVPWLAIGYSQAGSPLAGFAPVAGVYGVSFATVVCAGLLWVLVSGERRARIVSVLALALVFGAGNLLKRVAWTTPQGAPVRIALLQGNISQDLKFQAERYAATLATYRRLIEASRARLIVLPETAIPRFLDAVDPEYLKDIARIAVERNADVLIGVPIRDADGRYFNSLISVGASPTQRYDKSHLVPFGEFVPAGFGWVVRTLKIPLIAK